MVQALKFKKNTAVFWDSRISGRKFNQGPTDAAHTRSLLLATNANTKVLTQITDQQTVQTYSTMPQKFQKRHSMYL